MTDIRSHFSGVAAQYRDLRTTDQAPVVRIAESLSDIEVIRAADVGCGAGRYDLELFRKLAPGLDLYCMDGDANMLRELRQHLLSHGFRSFHPVLAYARSLPLRASSLDAVVTFNAVHHFRVREFLREAGRVLRPGGRLFVYTRLRSQNRSNIWGMHFPSFWRKETRLFSREEFQALVEGVPGLTLESVEFFRYERVSNLVELLEKARRRHYSTFCLYSPKELAAAFTRFEDNLRRHYRDLAQITWHDENVMFIARRVHAARRVWRGAASRAGMSPGDRLR